VLVRKIRTRAVSNTEAEVYLNKAEQFLRAMREAIKSEDWDAAGLNAIHAAISAPEATKIASDAERFFEWVKGMLP